MVIYKCHLLHLHISLQFVLLSISYTDGLLINYFKHMTVDFVSSWYIFHGFHGFCKVEFHSLRRYIEVNKSNTLTICFNTLDDKVHSVICSWPKTAISNQETFLPNNFKITRNFWSNLLWYYQVVPKKDYFKFSHRRYQQI